MKISYAGSRIIAISVAHLTLADGYIAAEIDGKTIVENAHGSEITEQLTLALALRLNDPRNGYARAQAYVNACLGVAPAPVDPKLERMNDNAARKATVRAHADALLARYVPQPTPRSSTVWAG